MKNENLIHVKLDYDEALRGKSENLEVEMQLLQVVKVIERYKKLRSEELKIKTKVHRKLKELNTSINKIEKILPEIEIPELEEELEKINSESQTNIEHKISKTKKEKNSNLESEIQEIQRRLRELNQ